MKAIVRERYGESGVLELKEMPKPELKGKEVLVRVLASSLNKADWHMMSGSPFPLRFSAGFPKPKKLGLGADVAGVVEAIGAEVKQFKVGDEVYGDLSGCGFGAWAEYLTCPEEVLAHKPSELSFEAAAALPMAAVTALQGIRDKAKVKAGDRVLINGASGGVGSYAIQIAKILGAEVTAVCSSSKHAQALALGADEVIDYRQLDFTKLDRKWSVVFDMVANHSLAEISGVLESGGRYACGAVNFAIPFLAPWYQWRKSQQMTLFMAKPSRADLQTIAQWAEAGELESPIEATYSLDDVPAAMQLFAEGGRRGKIVIVV